MTFEEFQIKFPWPKQQPAIGPKEFNNWFQDDRKDMLSRFIPSASIAMELGSWFGASALWMLKTNPNLKMICVDHWKGDAGVFGGGAGSLVIEAYDRFVCNLWPHQNRTVHLKMTTIEGLLNTYYCGIKPNVIYVDASHDFMSVLEDIVFATNLFPSAQLCGDDWSHDGVNIPIRMICEKKKWKWENLGAAWWIIR